MNKLNKKGMTLVELIISFMLVSVAMLYFTQALLVVQKIYNASITTTNNYVDESYAFRLIKEAVDEEKDINQLVLPNVEVIEECSDNAQQIDNISCYNIKFKFGDPPVSKELYIYKVSPGNAVDPTP